MRLGGPVPHDYSTPAEWIDLLDERGYTAATAPVGPDADEDEIAAYRDAAHDADVQIAEVGAWHNNPISPDPDERAAAIESCAGHLALAEALGADVCVNVAGSRGESWAAPHPENLSEETFDRVVDSVREIVDRVEPTETYYALESMPWAYPYSIETQQALLEAIDRQGFAVHFDPVNLLVSPELVFSNDAFVREYVETFGAQIRTVHLKDAALADESSVHIDEVRPGTGQLDYHALLTALDELEDDLDRELALLLEHLDTQAEYEQAAGYVREIADDVGVSL